MISGEYIVDKPVVYEGVPGALDKLENNPDLTRWPEMEATIPERTRILAQYLSSRLDVDESDLHERLAERTRHISVFQTLKLPEGDSFLGAFDGRAMSIRLATSGHNSVQIDDSLNHEITHSSMIGGVKKVTHLPGDNQFVKSGLITVDIDAGQPKSSKTRVMGSGSWLTEAIDEDTKNQAFIPSAHKQVYFIELVILRSLEDCIPGIYNTLLDAAFLGNYSKAEVWGMIEEKFGPLWIEYVEDELKLLECDPDTLDHNPIAAINNSVPEEIRATFKEAMLRNRAEFPGMG